MTDSTMAIIQASAFYEHNLPCPQNNVHQNPKSPEKPAKNFTMSNSSSVSSPSSTSSNALGYQQMANYSLSEETDNPVISFKPDYGDYIQARGPLLSFEQNEHVKRNLYPKMMSQDEYPIWEEDLQPSSGMQFAWMNDQMDNSTITNCTQTPEGSNNKRPFMGESMQAVKKQCGVSKKQAKEKSLSPAKDPQSLAAKNRRERISERLKVLQDLVPNGSKVDLVTMLEKATSYVKFLQLQVKVLATDEFWPAQGGKAPELSQVREAIDNILASHQRDTNSSSK